MLDPKKPSTITDIYNRLKEYAIEFNEEDNTTELDIKCALKYLIKYKLAKEIK
jgi:hypothetical protein